MIALHTDPDGRNINAACGSTYPESLQAEVVARQADMGVAFDGDADRMLAVDAAGSLVDGDQIIAICAIDRHRRGSLTGPAVVVTVMTNLGFRRSMADRGIEVVDTAVGDRLRPRGARPAAGSTWAASSRVTSSSVSWPPPAMAC